MVTAESVKAKLQGLINLANNTTGKTDTDLTAAVNALIAGFGQGGGSSGGTSSFEVTEGTITPTTQSQTLRLPWEKDSLPLFWVCIRQDFDTYVTPDSPATSMVLGGIVCFASGYTRASSSVTTKYLNMKITATTGYTGYIVQQGDFSYEVLDSDGLLAYSNSAAYKWQPGETYKYYIVDKVVG